MAEFRDSKNKQQTIDIPQPTTKLQNNIEESQLDCNTHFIARHDFRIGCTQPSAAASQSAATPSMSYIRLTTPDERNKHSRQCSRSR